MTVEQGANTVSARNPKHILAAAEDMLRIGGKAGRASERWYDRASQRIAAALGEWLDHADRLVA